MSSEESEEMRVDPQRAKQLTENLGHILQRMKAANQHGKNVRLIAVSKLKPASDILALHQSPHKHVHFGENYLQELQNKSNLLSVENPEIRWHFIGALQSNKCKPLAETVRGLWCVSSVDTLKKANGLEKGRRAQEENYSKKGEANGDENSRNGLRVLVQVNTSGEQSKSGVEPDQTAELCRHIVEKCPHLRLSGLMTIGAIARSQTTTPEAENEDFKRLLDIRDRIVKELGLKESDLELSMGMSGDFEAAIRQGSDEVRVGTKIFGERSGTGSKPNLEPKKEVEEGRG